MLYIMKAPKRLQNNVHVQVKIFGLRTDQAETEPRRFDQFTSKTKESL
jgi:hypothetical protein